MKNFILISFFLLAVSAQAQSTITTVTIGVSGDCDQCKEAIENAADIKGVKVCKWDSKLQQAVVTFDASKVSQEKIEQAIAAKGYDTEHYKTTEAAYNKLPKCCRYKDSEKVPHSK
jgi:copper chaperone CopZ